MRILCGLEYGELNRLWRHSGTCLLVLLTVVAAILRISLLGSKSLWLDEGLTAQIVTLPLRQLAQKVVYVQMNMYLYYLVLHGWILLAGTSEFMLRVPSAVLAAATVPLVAALGAQLGDRNSGRLGALFLTVNASSIQYAQTARAYALLMMLVTLSAVFFVRSTTRSSLANYTGYVVSGTCSTYAHLFGILVLPSQWLSLWLFRPSRKAAVRVSLSMAIIGLLSLPAVVLAILLDRGQADWAAATSGKGVMALVYVLAGVFDGQPGRTATTLAALYCVCIALPIVRKSPENRPAFAYLLLSICVPICMTIVASTSKPLFVTRYLLIVLPFFVLAAAVGITRIRSRTLAIMIVLAMTALNLAQDYFYYRAEPLQDWRGAVNFVAGHAKPGDALVIYPNYNLAPLEYYVNRLGHPAEFPSISYEAHAARPREPGVREQPESLTTFLATGMSSRSRLWLVFASWDSGALPILQTMQLSHRIEADPYFPGVRVVLLESTRP